jgi:hypothetical protein
MSLRTCSHERILEMITASVPFDRRHLDYSSQSKVVMIPPVFYSPVEPPVSPGRLGVCGGRSRSLAIPRSIEVTICSACATTEEPQRYSEVLSSPCVVWLQDGRSSGHIPGHWLHPTRGLPGWPPHSRLSGSVPSSDGPAHGVSKDKTGSAGRLPARQCDALGSSTTPASHGKRALPHPLVQVLSYRISPPLAPRMSGIFGNSLLDLLRFKASDPLSSTFAGSFILTSLALARAFPAALAVTPGSQLGWQAFVVGGVLTGFGTRLGNGCTSGKGEGPLVTEWCIEAVEGLLMVADDGKAVSSAAYVGAAEF